MGPHWTAYLTALMTPVVAAIATWIGYQQWKTAHDKLRLELFEKRFAIYKAATTSISQVIMHGRHSQEDELAYLRGTAGAQWLLGSDVKTYLDTELWGKLVDLHSLEAQLDGLATGAQRTELLSKQLELKKWLSGQYPRLETLFLPYLGFQHLRGKR